MKFDDFDDFDKTMNDVMSRLDADMDKMSKKADSLYTKADIRYQLSADRLKKKLKTIKSRNSNISIQGHEDDVYVNGVNINTGRRSGHNTLKLIQFWMIMITIGLCMVFTGMFISKIITNSKYKQKSLNPTQSIEKVIPAKSPINNKKL